MSTKDEPSGSFWDLFSDTGPQQRSSFWDLFTQPAADGPLSPEEPAALKFNEDYVYWAMRNLPATEAPKHFLACGTIGTGKTKIIELFLKSIAPRFKPGREHPEQLILFDAKGDAMTLLASLGLTPEATNVWLLNPIDERSAVWNLGEAIDCPLMARHLATLLVPEEPNSTARYFTDAARELVYAVLLALNAVVGADWSLRDLLCALDSKRNLLAVTARDERAKVLAERIFEDSAHVGGVLSTLGTKLGRFEQVAALWHSMQTKVRKSGEKAPKTFSIQEFLKNPGVLVLGNDPVLRESFWPINAILLRALTQEILRRPDTLQPRHWFVLDEFRAMERVDSIHNLLNLGRSKGASVLLGIQSFDGLVGIYEEHAANDILTVCTHKTFLRAGGPKTAGWAQAFFGSVRRAETTYSEDLGPGLGRKQVQHSVKERSLFMASFFLNLPFPKAGGHIVSVNDVPSQERVIVAHRSFDEVLEWTRKPKGIEEEHPGVVRRTNPKEQILKLWNAEEELIFCGKRLPKGQGKKKARRKSSRRQKAKPTNSPSSTNQGEGKSTSIDHISR